MNIAFIANGESALLTKAGRFIDSCDVVIRLGLYETAGYEEFVGNKTTIYGTAKWKYMARSPELTSWMMEDLDEYYNAELRTLLEYDKDPSTKNKTFETYRPTIGTRFLHKAIKDFEGHFIYVKGFDFFTTGHYFNKNHSYTNCSHPIVLERLHFLKLVKSKTINLI